MALRTSTPGMVFPRFVPGLPIISVEGGRFWGLMAGIGSVVACAAGPRWWWSAAGVRVRARNKKKEKGRKNGRGIFRSLVSLSHRRESLSDCGLNPTLPESDCSRRWFFAPLFWLHMLRARPILGVCLLSQPFQCLLLENYTLLCRSRRVYPRRAGCEVAVAASSAN